MKYDRDPQIEEALGESVRKMDQKIVSKEPFPPDEDSTNSEEQEDRRFLAEDGGQKLKESVVLPELFLNNEQSAVVEENSELLGSCAENENGLKVDGK